MTAAQTDQPALFIVDTNVVVAGLLTDQRDSPPAAMLDATLAGAVRYLLSVELLAEYRTVLLRKRIRDRHRLDPTQVDALLEMLAADAVVVDIAARREAAPDPGDDHLWRMLATRPDATLVTGDAALWREGTCGARVLTPREWLDRRRV